MFEHLLTDPWPVRAADVWRERAGEIEYDWLENRARSSTPRSSLRLAAARLLSVVARASAATVRRLDRRVADDLVTALASK